MSQMSEDLIESFERYEGMQEAHIKCLDTDDQIHHGMQRFNFERARAFEDLKNKLTPMLKRIRREDSDGLKIALACQDRLASIMERDDLLARRMDEYRDRLQQHLEQLRQGKKALRGYGYGGTGSPTSPRFVSEAG